LEPPGHEEERKTKEDLEEVSYRRGTERRKDVEGGDKVGSGQKSLEKLRGSPLLLHRRQQEMMIMNQGKSFKFLKRLWSECFHVRIGTYRF
jgi:hypothetical protein